MVGCNLDDSPTWYSVPIRMFAQNGWPLIALVWLICSFATGAILAALYKRLHPSLAFYKLWAFWTVLTSLLAAGIYLLGLI